MYNATIVIIYIALVLFFPLIMVISNYVNTIHRIYNTIFKGRLAFF